jgi:hypothetical protein
VADRKGSPVLWGAALPLIADNCDMHKLPEFWMNVFQLLAWCAAIAGGLWAIVRGLGESRENRKERELRRRWDQAKVGKELVDELIATAWNAMTMLDWSGGRSFDIGGGQLVSIDDDTMRKALVAKYGLFDPTETYIRDAFDNFFFHMRRIEHAVEIALVDFDDVRYPIEYYIRLMAVIDRPLFEGYMRFFGFDLALAFAQRIPEWSTP